VRPGLCAAILVLALAPAASAIASGPGPNGSYGNEAGCRFAADGSYDDDTLLRLSADRYDTFATGCEFLQGLRASDGSKVLTMLCSHEGETLQSIEFMRIVKHGEEDAYDLYSQSGEHIGGVWRCM